MVEAMKTRVMLADDHRMFREALRILLGAEPDIEVIAEAGSGAETLDAVANYLPDVLILDIALPDIQGIEVARIIGRRFDTVKIIALSGYSDRLFVDEMLKAGARAYVLKSSGADELIGAIRIVNSGQRFLSPALAGPMARGVQADGELPVPPISVLGRREQQVLCLVADGRRSAEIASQLGISTATVDVHRRNIKQKLRLRTTAELTRYVVREGLRSA
jgi:two-component system NarL family response regulator